jgi:DNA-binding transcriptional ArsR family regulator
MVKHDATLDAVFKALGDPGRRSMLARLARGEATLGQLAEPLSMSLPAVHQHLAVLESAGLVACEKRGRERWCRLEPGQLDRAERWIAQHRARWAARLDSLDDYLSSSDSRTAAERRRTSPSARRKRT